MPDVGSKSCARFSLLPTLNLYYAENEPSTPSSQPVAKKARGVDSNKKTDESDSYLQQSQLSLETEAFEEEQHFDEEDLNAFSPQKPSNETNTKRPARGKSKAAAAEKAEKTHASWADEDATSKLLSVIDSIQSNKSYTTENGSFKANAWSYIASKLNMDRAFVRSVGLEVDAGQVESRFKKV